VYLADECILRTGGVLKMTGSHRNSFIHNNESHTAEITWGYARGLSLPYQLYLDGQEIVNAKIVPRNWPAAFIPVVAFLVVLIAGAFVFSRPH
jgi:hypothetical protein